MSELELHRTLVWFVLGSAVATFGILTFVNAPYGRHYAGGWGPTMPSRAGWVLMESPAVVAFTWIFSQGAHRAELVPLVLLGMWQAHYVHRTFIFPFRMRIAGKRMPVLIAVLALAFNGCNAYVNARWISHFGVYPSDWLGDPRMIAGAALFATGLAVNLHADTTLLSLRRPGETGYKIPRGGFYEVVSCPNYLGELLEWTGWAIATWSGAGLAFAVYTAANLVPRALANHRWYASTFPDYPARRKALIPFVL